MKFLCPKCQAKYQIAEEKVVGRSVKMKCRQCGELIHVGEAAERDAKRQGTGARPKPPSAALAATDSRVTRGALSAADRGAPVGVAPRADRMGGAKGPSTRKDADPSALQRPRPVAAVPRPGSSKTNPLGGGVSASALGAREGRDAREAGEAHFAAGGAGALEGAFQAGEAHFAAGGAGALEGAFQAVVGGAQLADDEPPLGGDEWYVGIGEKPIGPIHLREIRERVINGEIVGESLVWRDGFEEWRPLRDFPELAAVLEEALFSVRSPHRGPHVGAAAFAGVLGPAQTKAAEANRAQAKPSRVTQDVAGVRAADGSPAEAAEVSDLGRVAARRASPSARPVPPQPPANSALVTAESGSRGGLSRGTAAHPHPAASEIGKEAVGKEAVGKEVVGKEVVGKEAVGKETTGVRTTGVLVTAAGEGASGGGRSHDEPTKHRFPPEPEVPSLAIEAGAPRISPIAHPTPGHGEVGAAPVVQIVHHTHVPLSVWFAMGAAVIFGIVIGVVLFGNRERPAEARTTATVSQLATGAPERGVLTEPEPAVAVLATAEVTVEARVGEGSRGSGTKRASPAEVPSASPMTEGLKGLSGLRGSGAPQSGPNAVAETPQSAGRPLDSETLSRTVSRYTPSIRRSCWIPALDSRAADAPSSARVSASITVAPSGRVQGVTTSGDPRGYTGLSACIQSRIRVWEFPPSSGSTQVNVPFVFAVQ